MEYDEYLPSIQAREIHIYGEIKTFTEKNRMKNKILTENVVLRFVCPSGHDDVLTSPFDIMGHCEVYCGECKKQMLLHDECLIKN